MSEFTVAREVLEQLPETLRARRQARGLTYREAAAQAGISFSFFQKLENGAGSPTVEIVIKLLTWLDEDG